jgi:mono/diheme cytochrome c family protein
MLGIVLALSTYLSSIGMAAEPGGAGDARIANAWQVLRTVDCARCHGKDYTGLAAPSIVQYAATQSKAMFDRIVLDGNPVRGMPGYRGNAYVADNIDAIYEYFAARASGKIGADYRPPASN